MIILDSDVLSGLMRDSPDQRVTGWLDSQSRESVWTTAITLMEIRFGIALLPPSRQRSSLEGDLKRILNDILEARILAFDASAASATAMLMAERQLRGRRGDIRDSMIAGIAIAHQGTLATRNARHFEDLPVPVVNPWTA
jgi:predicted nucleic acid-binding protein